MCVLGEQRIIHTTKSLWWFYQNLPLCQSPPTNMDYIREKIPAIVREKVNIFFLNLYNSNEVIFTNKGVIYKCANENRKSLKNFSHSKSFDESSNYGGGWRDTNNNRNFRRSTSTMSLMSSSKSMNPMRITEVREI
jgi:hypothetical protein